MKYEFSKRSKKFTAVLIVFSFLSVSLSPLFSQKAQAQWVVYDPANFAVNTVTSVNTTVTAINTTSQVVKDFGLDSLAWMIANLIIERIAASTVKWINTGFKGDPAFVTDPEGYFKDLGDKIAGQYIFSNPNLNFLCGPIQAKIRLALTNGYVQDNLRWQCTLTQVGRNLDDFMGDFQNGGWDSFFELTQKPQNNPIGAYLQAQDELNLQIATRQGTKKLELDWGNGFMSFETCGPEGKDADGTCIGRAQISTPGSVISDQLNNVLNTGNNKLAAADEINEIVGALLNQLIAKVVGGIGNGLRSLSSPDPADSGRIFTNQLASSTAASTVDYFDNPQDTSILDVPPPPVPPPPPVTRPIPPACNPADPAYNPILCI